MSIMDSSYCEKKFLNDFMKLYESSDEYDYTILFDDFYYNFISGNTEEFLNTVYHYYYIMDENEEFDDDVLFQTLYLQIEKMMCDKYESEADTDTDE